MPAGPGQTLLPFWIAADGSVLQQQHVVVRPPHARVRIVRVHAGLAAQLLELLLHLAAQASLRALDLGVEFLRLLDVLTELFRLASVS